MVVFSVKAIPAPTANSGRRHLDRLRRYVFACPPQRLHQLPHLGGLGRGGVEREPTLGFSNTARYRPVKPLNSLGCSFTSHAAGLTSPRTGSARAFMQVAHIEARTHVSAHLGSHGAESIAARNSSCALRVWWRNAFLSASRSSSSRRIGIRSVIAGSFVQPHKLYTSHPCLKIAFDLSVCICAE